MLWAAGVGAQRTRSERLGEGPHNTCRAGAHPARSYILHALNPKPLTPTAAARQCGRRLQLRQAAAHRLFVYKRCRGALSRRRAQGLKLWALQPRAIALRVAIESITPNLEGRTFCALAFWGKADDSVMASRQFGKQVVSL